MLFSAIMIEREDHDPQSGSTTSELLESQETMWNFLEYWCSHGEGIAYFNSSLAWDLNDFRVKVSLKFPAVKEETANLPSVNYNRIAVTVQKRLNMGLSTDLIAEASMDLDDPSQFEVHIFDHDGTQDALWQLWSWQRSYGVADEEDDYDDDGEGEDSGRNEEVNLTEVPFEYLNEEEKAQVLAARAVSTALRKVRTTHSIGPKSKRTRRSMRELAWQAQIALLDQETGSEKTLETEQFLNSGVAFVRVRFHELVGPNGEVETEYYTVNWHDKRTGNKVHMSMFKNHGFQIEGVLDGQAYSIFHLFKSSELSNRDIDIVTRFFDIITVAIDETMY